MAVPAHLVRSSFVLVAALLAAGCTPVNWLPDSSGFVFTDSKTFELLYLYDLSTNKTRLIKHIPACTPSPAVSPDGKRIAVARLASVRGNPNRVLEILLYNLEGKEVHRSGRFACGVAGEKEGLDPAAVFWSPRRDKLLVYTFDPLEKTAIYDLATRSLVLMDGKPLFSGGNPVRPDGKGFLLVRDAAHDGDPKVALIDWAGRERAIRMGPDALDTKEKRNILAARWPGDARWQGNTAEVGYGRFRLRIDTDKLAGTGVRVPDSEALVDGKVVLQRFTFASGTKVFMLESGQGQSDFELQVLKPGGRKPGWSRVFKEGMDGTSLPFSPSPDGKWLAVRGCTARPGGLDGALLIDHRGAVREVP